VIREWLSKRGVDMALTVVHRAGWYEFTLSTPVGKFEISVNRYIGVDAGTAWRDWFEQHGYATDVGFPTAAEIAQAFDRDSQRPPAVRESLDEDRLLEPDDLVELRHLRAMDLPRAKA
jgi:hypothetical protein